MTASSALALVHRNPVFHNDQHVPLPNRVYCAFRNLPPANLQGAQTIEDTGDLHTADLGKIARYRARQPVQTVRCDHLHTTLNQRRNRSLYEPSKVEQSLGDGFRLRQLHDLLYVGQIDGRAPEANATAFRGVNAFFPIFVARIDRFGVNEPFVRYRRGPSQRADRRRTARVHHREHDHRCRFPPRAGGWICRGIRLPRSG